MLRHLGVCSAPPGPPPRGKPCCGDPEAQRANGEVVPSEAENPRAQNHRKHYRENGPGKRPYDEARKIFSGGAYSSSTRITLLTGEPLGFFVCVQKMCVCVDCCRTESG